MANSNRVEHASETWLTDATVFEVNRTPAHSNHKCFTHDPQRGEHSDLTQSLDGEWRVGMRRGKLHLYDFHFAELSDCKQKCDELNATS